jgi:hypothetical protein
LATGQSIRPATSTSPRSKSRFDANVALVDAGRVEKLVGDSR